MPVEQADEAQNRPDQRPDAELLGAERADDDRRDDEARHERDGVDAVDQDHVAAEQPHGSVAQVPDRRDDGVSPAVHRVAGLDAPPQLAARLVPQGRVGLGEARSTARSASSSPK